MKRRTLLHALACAPLLASFGGISKAAAQPTRSGLITSFGRVPPPSDIKRVYATGGPASVLLPVLAPHKMLGWSLQMSPEVLDALGSPLRDLPMLGRLSGRGSTMSSETLLALKPDLILDAGSVDDTYLSAAQRVTEQTGIPYVVIEGRLADSARQLREAGHLLGVEERGNALADYADGILSSAALVREAIPPEKRPRVYYGRGLDGLETGMLGSLHLEAIDIAGGYNVAAQGGKKIGIARVSLEQVIGWAPEVILTQDSSFASRILEDPRWRTIPAVRTKRIYCAPSIPFGWLDVPPSISRLVGVIWLLAHLHGVGKDDLERKTAEFHRLFYGIKKRVQ
ncbi:MAG: iron ABC transporter substrate-binding protein [Betaproteobacteria bacterium]|nr:iron ABC transporter substrate-binding protein [Betaproteobacteria bacterium]